MMHLTLLAFVAVSHWQTTLAKPLQAGEGPETGASSVVVQTGPQSSSAPLIQTDAPVQSQSKPQTVITPEIVTPKANTPIEQSQSKSASQNSITPTGDALSVPVSKTYGGAKEVTFGSKSLSLPPFCVQATSNIYTFCTCSNLGKYKLLRANQIEAYEATQPVITVTPIKSCPWTTDPPETCTFGTMGSSKSSSTDNIITGESSVGVSKSHNSDGPSDSNRPSKSGGPSQTDKSATPILTVGPSGSDSATGHRSNSKSASGSAGSVSAASLSGASLSGGSSISGASVSGASVSGA